MDDSDQFAALSIGLSEDELQKTVSDFAIQNSQPLSRVTKTSPRLAESGADDLNQQPDPSDSPSQHSSSQDQFFSLQNTTGKVKVDDQRITNNQQNRYVEHSSGDEDEVISVQRSSKNSGSDEDDSSAAEEESELTDHDAIRANLNASGPITISGDSETEERPETTRP